MPERIQRKRTAGWRMPEGLSTSGGRASGATRTLRVQVDHECHGCQREPF